jgi:uncharacterized protein
MFVGCILLSGFAARVAARPLEDATAAIERREYATALQLLRPLAEQGNADAQVILAMMFITGRGLPQDHAEAVKWLRKGANHRNAVAQCLLRHATDQGLLQDDVAVVAGPQKAADEGNDVAQCLLGVRYGAGDHVQQDYAEAAKWFRKAADQGNADAQAMLGALHAPKSAQLASRAPACAAGSPRRFGEP